MTAPGGGWLLDLGNSRLKVAALDAHGRRGGMFAITNDDRDALPMLLEHLGPVRGAGHAWLASVATPMRTAAVEAALREAGFAVHRVRTQASCGRLRVAYADPARLGVDRFLARLGASQRDDGPWLLVTAGSALTVDLLRADGAHVGGLIAPMPETMQAALADRFAQLDVGPGVATEFAADTADAVASGCAGAALGLVERSLRQAQRRLGVAPTLLVAGGGADLFTALDHVPMHVTPTLVLDGLAAFALGQGG